MSPLCSMVSRAIKLARPARQRNVMFRIQDHFCSMVNIIYVTLAGEQMLILFAAVPGARGWRGGGGGGGDKSV